MIVDKYLGSVYVGEEQLAEAYRIVSDRHSAEFEISEMCMKFAEWSRGHMAAMKPVIEQYGMERQPDPERLRASLFHGARIGGMGLLKDLQDLSTLANAVRTQWTILLQAASTVQDKALEQLAADMGDQLDRELEWLCTHIKNAAPQVVIVVPDAVSETKASLPKKVTGAAIPDHLWAPVAGGLLMLAVGLVSLLLGRSFLFPSLGPSAYLQAENPAHPSTRFANTVVGHLIGVLAGFAGVLLFNAMNDPVTLQAKQLTAGRMGAAVVALALTILICLLLKMTHPPAGATTLLVALGSIKTLPDIINLMVGVLIVATLGELVRRLRLGSIATRAAVAENVPTNAGR